MDKFRSRISLTFPIKIISIEVCNNYNLGELVSNKLIKVGFEDFTYILKTNIGKFIVKIFSNEKTDEECFLLAKKANLAYEKGVSCPKIFKSNNSELVLILNLKNKKFRLCVMEYINGRDLFSLNAKLNYEEIKFIAKQTAILHKVNFIPPFTYDNWAIINFENEFKKLNYLLPNNLKQNLQNVLSEFKNINFNLLENAFVHGDICSSNIIKHKNGKLYIIDYSTVNYQPKVIDLAVSIADLCVSENITTSNNLINCYLTEYESHNLLNNYEKQVLKTLIKVQFATTILQTNKEAKINNDNSKENLDYLNTAINNLKLVDKLKI